MAKQGGLFSGGDPSLMTMAYKAAAAEKPVDISGTLESASQAYKEGLETLGEGLGKAAKVIGEQAAELWRTKYKEKFRFAANQFLIDNNIDPWDPFGTKTAAGTYKPIGSGALGQSFKDMNILQKGLTGAVALDALGGPLGMGGDDEPAVMPGPIDQSGYLTSGLTPAQLSDVYGTQGSGTGIAGSMPSLSQSYDYDPVNSTIAELLRQKEEYR